MVRLFGKIPTYVITIPQRHGRTNGETTSPFAVAIGLPRSA